MTTLFTNIRQLVNVRDSSPVLRGAALAELPVYENAFLLVDGDHIAGYGSMNRFPYRIKDFKYHIDVNYGMVLPSWCDSHTHLVHAGSRETEFVQKIKGMSYAEIAAKGGGILASAKKLNQTTEDELFNQAYQRLQDLIRLGTGAIEIKSGYGLTVEAELKMLRVIRRLKSKAKIPIKATFLGAHAIPAMYKNDPDSYIQLIIEEMLPVIGQDRLADYIDVFCENGFFTLEQTEKLCAAGKVYGLKPKLHVNQLNSIGGIEAGIRAGAVSLDHLETLTGTEIGLLSKPNSPMATLLPTAAFFLRMAYQPARQLIDSGSAVTLASDYNPGSSPSGNMNFVVSLSCIQLRMLPQEAINAATLNGAHAMELGEQVGSIQVGKLANLIITQPVPSLSFIPYSFGSNLIRGVMVCGDWQEIK